MVPVSIRTGNESDPWTNRVSGIVADLPTDVADPLERLARCRSAMEEAKRQFELIPAEALAEGAQSALPVVATAAMRLASRLQIANRVNLPANVVISNVPGPRHPLYFAGARLDNYIPVSTIAEGMGLNITVHSYLDRLDFGLVAARELVPDLWDLADLHIEEIDVLFAALGIAPPVPQGPASMRVGNKYVGRRTGKGTARTATTRAVTGERSTSTSRAASTSRTARRGAASTRTTGADRPRPTGPPGRADDTRRR